MRSFVDLKGREWRLAITVADVERVRQDIDVLLTKLFDDNCEELARIDSDVVLLARVLWSLVQPQAVEMTANEFMEGLGGDALGQAVEALVRAVADFFTNPERRQAAHALLDKAMESQTAMATAATEAIQSLDTSALVKSYLGFVSSSPELPVSTPGGTALDS
jgi:hypothetical protein